MSKLSSFIRYQRKKHGYTQEELSQKAGVGLRFIREVEQGKESIQLDKVEQVLQLFGFQLFVSKHRINPYDIWQTYLNQMVVIEFKNRLRKTGILIGEITSKNEGIITGWKFIPNSMVVQYLKNKSETLIEELNHAEIDSIAFMED